MNRILKGIVVIVVIAAVVVVGLGISRGWFSFSSSSTDGKSNSTFTVDTEKMRQDKNKAAKSFQELGNPVEDKAVPAEKVSGQAEPAGAER